MSSKLCTDSEVIIAECDEDMKIIKLIEKIPVHKIFFTKCNFFAMQAGSNFKDAKEKEILIPCDGLISPESIKVFIKLIYASSLGIYEAEILSFIFQLNHLSNYYEYKNLYEYTLLLMIDNLTIRKLPGIITWMFTNLSMVNDEYTKKMKNRLTCYIKSFMVKAYENSEDLLNVLKSIGNINIITSLLESEYLMVPYNSRTEILDKWLKIHSRYSVAQLKKMDIESQKKTNLLKLVNNLDSNFFCDNSRFTHKLSIGCVFPKKLSLSVDHNTYNNCGVTTIMCDNDEPILYQEKVMMFSINSDIDYWKLTSSFYGLGSTEIYTFGYDISSKMKIEDHEFIMIKLDFFIEKSEVEGFFNMYFMYRCNRKDIIDVDVVCDIDVYVQGRKGTREQKINDAIIKTSIPAKIKVMQEINLDSNCFFTIEDIESNSNKKRSLLLPMRMIFTIKKISIQYCQTQENLAFFSHLK